MQRKKKLRLIQSILLIIGSLILFYTYSDRSKLPTELIITEETQKKIKQQLDENPSSGDTFYNIEYSGLDLAGNRYILKSKEAKNSKVNQ